MIWKLNRYFIENLKSSFVLQKLFFSNKLVKFKDIVDIFVR